MKKKRLIMILSALLIVTLTVTGCGKESKASGQAVKIGKSKISANAYYKEIKSTNISKLVDMIDHKILDKKYPTDDEETSSIDEQVEQIKSYIESTYGSEDEDTFNSLVQSYYGVNNEEELREALSLEYKRSQAVKTYIRKNLTDKEIKDYYNDNIYGDMTASHILISVDVADDATDDEKTAAEEKALKKAKKIIKKLDAGEDFAKLAEKYSDDDATKSEGGSLGTFKYDDMDEDFSKACYELEEGKYTEEPVKTQYGYHIILKTKQKAKAKLSKIKSDIKDALVTQKQEDDSTLYYKTLISIRKEKGITWNDSDLEKAYNDLMDSLIENASSSSSTSSN